MNPENLHEKLTAYALGELSPEDRTALDIELRKNPDLQKELIAIQQTVSALETHFEQDEKSSLSSEQRDAITSAIRKKNVTAFPAKWLLPASIAAGFIIVLGITTQFISRQATDLTQHEAPEVETIKGMPLDLPEMEVASLDEEVDTIAYTDNAVELPSSQPTRLLAKKEDGRQSQTGKQHVAPAVPEEAQVAQAPIGVAQSTASSQVMKGLFAGRSAEGRTRAFRTKINGAAMTMELADADSVSVMYHAPSPEPRRENLYGPSLEHYDEIRENTFKRVSDHPLSTFSIDVDTASYSNIRRFLTLGSRPPKDAVRIEEMVNYFNYEYAPPTDEHPFAAHIESATCPWNSGHRLLRIGLKGKVIEQAERPPLNLVFLLDVSGSMEHENKLPLVKKALKALLNQLDERDRISIVVYAGASGLVLEPTSAANKQAIIDAMDRLRAGGSTNGGAGIDLAYKTALENFDQEGVNRVILCTDGDFNVGTIQTGDLVRDVETKAKDGIFLSVLGFGMGNYKDSTLEQLADKGNGNYAYIDTFSEARKVLVDQMSGTLVTIAKDVKIQVEFNPQHIAGYRLIGYENRMLNKEDFNDDKKDAGEIGAGHTVTALYELVPAGQPVDGKPSVDALKYQPETVEPQRPLAQEILTVKLRYKQPDSDTSTKVEFPFVDDDQYFEQASQDFRFATSVAGFGMLLRDSEHKGDLTYEQVIEWAADSKGRDAFGYRSEFIDLVRNAKSLK